MELCPANGRLQPGFRFHPTNEELVMYYLKRKVLGKCLDPEIIREVDVYQFHPQDLRELSYLKKDLNWYFFCPRGRKYGCGERTNRATECGYWKATGVDRVVSYMERGVGKIKTLVFHEGKPPKGKRTDWVMHEYKLEDGKLADEGVYQGSYVLCKIYKKSGWGPKNSEQYGAPFVEEEWEDYDTVTCCAAVCTSELHSGAAVSAVDQAPMDPPLPYGVVSSVPATANFDSYPNYDPETLLMLQEPAPMLNDYEEIDRMLDRFVADDNAEVLGSLWGFNTTEEQEEEGGFNLIDLDAPL